METRGYSQKEAKGPLAPVTYELSPGEGDVIVKVEGCGLCHTDLGFLDGNVEPRGGRPLIPGHEVSGVVISPDDSELLGKQVIVPAVWPCGDCGLCRAGRPNACQRQRMPGNDVPGGFAGHLAAPAASLAVLPKEVDRETIQQMAVIADAVSTPYEAVHRSSLAEGDFAAVIGAGGVGGFCVQIAAAKGATVVAIDISDERLALAADHGAKATLNASGKDEREVKKLVRQTAKDLGAPRHLWKIFETSGTAAGQKAAFSLLGPAATLMVVGFTMQKLDLRLSNLMAFDAAAIGIWGCRPSLYKDCIDLVLDGKVALSPYVEFRPMDSVNDCLDDFRNHRLKRRVVLTP